MGGFISLYQEMRDGVVAFSPARFPYQRFALALMIGVAGSILFAWLDIPLPWLLGSMFACSVAALSSAPIAAPSVVRPPTLVILGILLGASFTPRFFYDLEQALPTLLGLIVFMVVAAACCGFYFHKVAGFDAKTAYFSGMPGGLMEMVILGDANGADARLIALVHSGRILLIISFLPILIELLFEVDLQRQDFVGQSFAAISLGDSLAIAATAAAGILIGHVLHIPAKYLLGPLAASAAVHALGWSDFRPPAELVNIAQIILGTTIGCRFLGFEPMLTIRILFLSLGATIILLCLTFLFGFGMGYIIDQPPLPIILAYSPGGLAEMSLVAVSLQIEVVFVTIHHVVRVFAIMVSAGYVFAFAKRYLNGKRRT